MEKVAPDITYRRLKNVSDWRLVEENQRAALAAIVHGISRLDAAGHWGDGTTSASDGQRFAMPHKVLQRIYSTRFNDLPSSSTPSSPTTTPRSTAAPVECTDRDAPFVLDGVLYHESDLDLEEHYTDTHGYTEINFAAFGMIGMRFCPRIRSLHRQRIYCADPDRDHGVLEPVLQRGRRAVNFRLIAEQWDRIGQFYSAAANRELGRALKTEFVLQYMSEPKLRAKVRRGWKTVVLYGEIKIDPAKLARPCHPLHLSSSSTASRTSPGHPPGPLRESLRYPLEPCRGH